MRLRTRCNLCVLFRLVLLFCMSLVHHSDNGMSGRQRVVARRREATNLRHQVRFSSAISTLMYLKSPTTHSQAISTPRCAAFANSTAGCQPLGFRVMRPFKKKLRTAWLQEELVARPTTQSKRRAMIERTIKVWRRCPPPSWSAASRKLCRSQKFAHARLKVSIFEHNCDPLKESATINFAMSTSSLYWIAFWSLCIAAYPFV